VPRPPKDRQKLFYVYILANLSGTLYVGLTDDLRKRVEEHRLGLVDRSIRIGRT
jgi:predicted GIY-YIG superfamily endonuclease